MKKTATKNAWGVSRDGLVLAYNAQANDPTLLPKYHTNHPLPRAAVEIGKKYLKLTK